MLYVKKRTIAGAKKRGAILFGLEFKI